ncbi:hypothetical protein ERN12_01955 [Rhodobacteraceae bacterium]|nr:hypothetical protein ERN12_01955 [Paracoccaceae bacterium]
MNLSDADPKGLMRESFRIDGIGMAECRSIFMDWALSLAPGTDEREAMRVVMAQYQGPEDHPMTLVLSEGLTREPAPRKRAGRTARRAPRTDN